MQIDINWGSNPIPMEGKLDEKVARLTAMLAFSYFIKGVNTPVHATALHAESQQYLTSVRNALERGNQEAAEILVDLGLFLLNACREICMSTDCT